MNQNPPYRNNPARGPRPPRSAGPTLARRILPAVALGGVAGALVMALDHPGAGGASTATALPAASGGETVTTDAVSDPTASAVTAAGDGSVGTVSTTVPAAPQVRATSAPSSSPSSTAPVTAASSSDTCKSYTGPAEYNRFGSVQVQASVSSGGRICSVKVVRTPQDRRSVRINNYAVPILNQQAMDAQSANIQGVSGATLTTWGYIDSLQAILDAAVR